MKKLIAFLSMLCLFVVYANSSPPTDFKQNIETINVSTDNVIIADYFITSFTEEIPNLSINQELEQNYFVEIPINLEVEKYGIETDFGDYIDLVKLSAKIQKNTKGLNNKKYLLNLKTKTCTKYLNSNVTHAKSSNYKNAEKFDSINKLLTRK